MRCDVVEIIRHEYDQMEVVAFDLFGRIIRHRMYHFGSQCNRKKWAIEQAKRWSEELYLWFDTKIYY